MRKLILILALFTLPAVAADSQQHGGVLGVSGGRYVFGQIGDTALSNFMLDTQTGRLWKYQTDKERGLVLVAITYTLADGNASLAPIDTDKELAALHRAKESEQPSASSPRPTEYWPSASQPSQSSTAQPDSTALPSADPALASMADTKAQAVVSLVKAGDMDGAKKIVDSIQDEALKSLVRAKVDKALKQ